ncbi:unnamed protein product [Clonostachys rosea]|uniref:G-protein coupled receptors family 1 profile domain-containing protein n=1 Tax=Bionectria ochroleuca TaxID=29856 RepID=A0ABY6U5J8_BIOOC|nr:unnamed protein product [Clonostachys rosea]
MAPLLKHRSIQVSVPVGGQVMSVILTMISLSVLSVFLTKRVLTIKYWRKLPFVVWLLTADMTVTFAIYLVSYLFVFVTALLQYSFGVNSSYGLCEGAILLCLVCYVLTKLIYLFLVEKAYIIRNSPKRRMQSKLYLFNSFGIMTVFLVVVVLNFYYRIVRMEEGICYIGMKGLGIIPLITFDGLANTYLTMMFLIPLRKLYSFKNMARTSANIHLRNVAFRTFVGSLCTLLSSAVNLTVLAALNGEPGWVCLMCCNCDVLFSAIVIYWVTSKDNAGTTEANSSRNVGNGYAENSMSSAMRRPTHHVEREHSSSMNDEVVLMTPARSNRGQSIREDDDNSSKTSNTKEKVIVATTIKPQSSVDASINTTIDANRRTDDEDLYRPCP